MALSDEERRRLDALAEQLSGEDPRLARNLEGGSSGRPALHRVTYAVLAVLAGLALVIIGVSLQLPIIGVLGFALQCAGAYWFASRLGLFDGFASFRARSHHGGSPT